MRKKLSNNNSHFRRYNNYIELRINYSKSIISNLLFFFLFFFYCREGFKNNFLDKKTKRSKTKSRPGANYENDLEEKGSSSEDDTTDCIMSQNNYKVAFQNHS